MEVKGGGGSSGVPRKEAWDGWGWGRGQGKAEQRIMELRLAVFDFDGTLMDSQRLILRAMGQAFAAAGLDVPSDDAVRGVIGLSLERAIAALAGSFDAVVRRALAEHYKAAYFALREEGAEGERLFPGARALIETLHGRPDILLGIATGKSRRGLYGALEREGLRHCFVTLQTADDAPSKPHPAMLERAMAEVGSTPARTVMIGDAVFDMAMAANAGVAAIGVAWGYHDVADLRAAGACHIASEMAALADDIERVLPPVGSEQVGLA